MLSCSSIICSISLDAEEEEEEEEEERDLYGMDRRSPSPKFFEGASNWPPLAAASVSNNLSVVFCSFFRFPGGNGDNNQLQPWEFLLGAGNMISWNSFITAVDYFEFLYPNKHIDKVFSVAYMGSTLLMLVLLNCWPTWNQLPISPKNEPQERPHIAYVVLVLALVVCSLADGLTAGSLIRATRELPGRYMQAVFAGNASSGIKFLKLVGGRLLHQSGFRRQ
ncbi:unnamed protein product [Ilex paraguariensis]|uniref:Uncharacterized protein n=1 Tax=Ilex paraguariensis TaxID=185542 RepID=A0ABC8UGS8_9AQUA